jgi:cyclopropane-fatty-acyl-phospholipid synthase
MAQPLQKIIASRYGGRDLPVTLILPDGGRVPLSARPEIEIFARTWAGLKALAQPALGNLARAYVRNDIDFSGATRTVLNVAEGMVGSITHGRDTLRDRWRGYWNQQRSSRKNISHHYDVSDAFYRLWLDPRMVYSCAYFRHDGDTLAEAQAAKLDHICRKLMLQPGETLLDIGCGWGGLIFWAAENYGVTATGITLSRHQFEHVEREIAARGLTGRVSVKYLDYEDLPKDVVYDKIASVGMFEHVGPRRYPRYFGAIHRLLKPGGFVLNHGITQNMVGADSLGSGIGAFVEDYVFPGGALAHVAPVIEGLAREGLELVDAEALREHYAKTLWCWLDGLETNAAAARAEVGEEKFRIWRVYLAGSAHAFERGWLSIFQLLAGKPLPDGHLPHPPTRDYMYLRERS